MDPPAASDGRRKKDERGVRRGYMRPMSSSSSLSPTKMSFNECYVNDDDDDDNFQGGRRRLRPEWDHVSPVVHRQAFVHPSSSSSRNGGLAADRMSQFHNRHHHHHHHHHHRPQRDRRRGTIRADDMDDRWDSFDGSEVGTKRMQQQRQHQTQRMSPRKHHPHGSTSSLNSTGERRSLIPSVSNGERSSTTRGGGGGGGSGHGRMNRRRSVSANDIPLAASEMSTTTTTGGRDTTNARGIGDHARTIRANAIHGVRDGRHHLDDDDDRRHSSSFGEDGNNADIAYAGGGILGAFMSLLPSSGGGRGHPSREGDVNDDVTFDNDGYDNNNDNGNDIVEDDDYMIGSGRSISSHSVRMRQPQQQPRQDYVVGGGQSTSSHSMRRPPPQQQQQSQQQSRQQSQHQQRSRSTSDDTSSYGGLLDVSSRNGRSIGGWSNGKSALSTYLDPRQGRRETKGVRRRRRRGGGGGANNDDDDRHDEYDDGGDDMSKFSGSSSHSPRRLIRSHSSASRNSLLSQASTSSPSQQSSGVTMTTNSSTSRKDTSFRLPKRFHPAAISRNDYLQEEHDISDDSIESLLLYEGGDGERRRRMRRRRKRSSAPASSSSVGSAVGDGSRRGSEESEDASSLDDEDNASSGAFSNDDRNDFHETISNLERLGFGIDAMDDNTKDYEGETGGASLSKNKKCRPTALSRRCDTDDDSDGSSSTAWWIKDLDAEGWFQHDTTEVYSDKMTLKRRLTGSAALVGESDDADLNEDIPHDNQARSISDSVVDDGKSQPNTHQDDHSDTSTTDVEDEDIDDWEERLWSVARAHYSQYIGDREININVDGASVSQCSLLEKKANNIAELDENSVKVQEQSYLLNYEAERNGVFAFRAILLQCIESYVKAVHHEVGDRAHNCGEEGNDEQDGTPKLVPRKFSANIMPPKVSHYIPLSTASALFLEVIKLADANREDASTIDAKHKSDLVTSILVDDSLNIFRRYQVITKKKSIKIGSDNEKHRKRLNKVLARSNDSQAALEDFLYGEMIDTGNEHNEQDEEGKFSNVCETKEHEIRLRRDIVRKFHSKLAEDDQNVCSYWENTMMCRVLLLNIQTIAKKTETCDTLYSQNLPRTPFRSEQPMAQVYSLRYTPTFLLRALISRRIKLVSDTNEMYTTRAVTYEDLSDLLFDEEYLMKRIVFQGPYEATLSHLSNWQSAIFFQSSIDDIPAEQREVKSYENLVTLLVSTLHCHLKSTLVHTGYQFSEAKSMGVDDNKDSTNMLCPVKSDAVVHISVQNYANIVAICLEIGRAHHHLGISLGRRQKEREKLSLKGDESSVASEAVDRSLHLEMLSYKNALHAYKAAIFILKTAEDCALLNGEDKDGNEVRQTGIKREIQQENKRNDSRRYTDAGDLPDNDLHDIREANVSVDLHLADTLSCLGFCHDKKSEYDKSLGAYRESLSLYIRHVGRFHKTVSNALHNMGAIHVELGQWKEASSCFRQCLAILKRLKEKEPMVQPSSQSDQTTKTCTEAQQMFVTMLCLAKSLAEQGQYNASVACFQEIIEKLETDKMEDLEPAGSDFLSGDVQSQLGMIHLNEAFKLSQAVNWKCHLLLFSGGNAELKDEGLSLTRQLNAERMGKDCIMKSIRSRRIVCYTAPMNKMKPDGGVFSSADNSTKVSSQSLDESFDFTFRISSEASPVQVEALAKDLGAAGRIEFRSRSYEAALSFCWESVLLRGLLISWDSSDDETSGTISNLLRFNRGFLKSYGAVFRVPENILAVLDFFHMSSITDSASIEFTQLLFLLGATYSRIRDFDRAQKVMHKAQAFLNPARFSGEIGLGAKGTLEEAVILLDRAFLHLRVGYIDDELVRVESASSNYKEAVRIFKLTGSHPIFSSRRILNENSEQKVRDDPSIMMSLNQRQRKNLDLVHKNGLACALHRLGQSYANQSRSEKAMRCFDEAAHILDETHCLRAELSNQEPLPLFPFTSRCFFEEISVISTSIVLSDVYERSGRISLESGSYPHSFRFLERAIGIREFVRTAASFLSTVDAESALQCLDDSKWDRDDMDCYAAMLLLIEKRELVTDKEASGGEEMSWRRRDSDRGTENAPLPTRSTGGH